MIFRFSSVWYNTDDDESVADTTEFEIEYGPDRVAAIVASAFVEDNLTEALKRNLTSDPRFFNEVFSPEKGILGSFGAKIRIGFLIGLYDQILRKELETISKIRNRFAHKRGVDSFTSKQIMGLVENLTAGEMLRLGVTKTASDEAFTRLVLPSDREQNPGEIIHPFIQLGASPRQRFIATCMMFIWLFDLMRGPCRETIIAASGSKDAT